MLVLRTPIWFILIIFTLQVMPVTLASQGLKNKKKSPKTDPSPPVVPLPEHDTCFGDHCAALGDLAESVDPGFEYPTGCYPNDSGKCPFDGWKSSKIDDTLYAACQCHLKYEVGCDNLKVYLALDFPAIFSSCVDRDYLRKCGCIEVDC